MESDQEVVFPQFLRHVHVLPLRFPNSCQNQESRTKKICPLAKICEPHSLDRKMRSLGSDIAFLSQHNCHDPGRSDNKTRIIAFIVFYFAISHSVKQSINFEFKHQFLPLYYATDWKTRDIHCTGSSQVSLMYYMFHSNHTHVFNNKSKSHDGQTGCE